LAIVAAAAAVLLVRGLELLLLPDARPALLVAVAVSALYGGAGPAFVALALVSVASRDPGVLVAGALLLAVCALFRRPAATEAPAGGSVTPGEPSSERANRLDGSDAPPAVVAPKTPRMAPPLREVTTEATWRFHHEQPLDITLPEGEQVDHLYLYSVLAECNDAFARMYGFRSAAEVIGTRLVVFLPPSTPENIEFLRSFIRSGYRLEDAESREIDRYGNARCFVNNLVGIFDRGQLVGAWGTQRDITERNRPAASQENRSRIHSSKSSSQ
jgi:PAS domain S-box-containing protein